MNFQQFYTGIRSGRKMENYLANLFEEKDLFMVKIGTRDNENHEIQDHCHIKKTRFTVIVSRILYFGYSFINELPSTSLPLVN